LGLLLAQVIDLFVAFDGIIVGASVSEPPTPIFAEVFIVMPVTETVCTVTTHDDV